jgi:DNA-binding transcriptional LysR family regulator
VKEEHAVDVESDRAAGPSGALRNLNLNLLLHLDALLAHRSVSQAARHLGLSQPTVSAALHRLRRQFGDQLLVRGGAQAELTPLGLQLQPLTAAALASVERVFTSTAVFDPAASNREFTLCSIDHWAASVGAALAARVARAAPAVRLRFVRPNGELLGGITDALRTVDGVIAPHGVLHGVGHTDLYSDDWVCLVDAGNRRVGELLDPAELSTLPWAVAVNESTADAGLRSEPLGMRQLRQAGVEPRITATVESYLAVPWFVAGTERIAIAHRRFAEQIAGVMGLRALDCPIPLRPMKVALWWHPQFEGDAGHRWLRETLRAMCDESQNAETR